jgi:hypothetical protein
MKYILFFFSLLVLSEVMSQTFYSDLLNNPIDGQHGFVGNGDIQFHQFSDTPDSVVVFGISDSYFCEDSFFGVEFAIMVNGVWKNHQITLYPYNASEWAYLDFHINDPFIQDLIRGSKYVYKYVDAHCSVERGEGSLAGVTAGFKKAGIPTKWKDGVDYGTSFWD